MAALGSLRCPFVLSKRTCPSTPASLPRRVTSPTASPVPLALHGHLNAPRDRTAAAAAAPRTRQSAVPSLLPGTSRPLPRLPLGQVSAGAQVRPSGAPLLPPSPTAPLAGRTLRSPAGASVPEPRQGRGEALPTLPRGNKRWRHQPLPRTYFGRQKALLPQLKGASRDRPR